MGGRSWVNVGTWVNPGERPRWPHGLGENTQVGLDSGHTEGGGSNMQPPSGPMH